MPLHEMAGASELAIKASHRALISHPDEITRLILEATSPHEPTGRANAPRWLSRAAPAPTTTPCPKGARSRQSASQQTSGYSINSWAATSIDVGIVRPSIFAVFALTTSSNIVGCWTGSSFGFSPRSMRSM